MEGRRPQNMLHVWSHSGGGIAILDMPVDVKTNEMKVFPKLLDLLDIRGCVVTADALNTQVETASAVIAGGADYLFPLKGNWPGNWKDIELFFKDYRENHEPDYSRGGKEHGRDEVRSVWMVENTFMDTLPGLRTLVCVERRRSGSGEAKGPSCTRTYYLTSLADVSAEDILRWTREHWAVENNLHWTLDELFGEDRCRARTGNAAANLSTFRILLLNALRQYTDKDPLTRRTWRNVLSLDYVCEQLMTVLPDMDGSAT